jgi:glycerol kinase
VGLLWERSINMTYIVTVDVGTSGMNSRLYDEKGNTYFVSSAEYKPRYESLSLVEQNPNDWYDAIVSTLKEVADYARDNNISIEAIAITSQRASVIPIDRNGEPLRDAIMWQDKRTVDICDRMQEKMTMKEVYKRTGLRINPYFSLPRILWIKENEKDIYDKTYKFMGVQDFLVYKMTGQPNTDWSQASRTMLMNIESLDWDEKIIETFDIDRNKLCDLVPPSTNIGSITEDFAKSTGLSTGTQVIICGGDQQNAAIALKTIEPKRAQANTGTGSFVMAYSEKPAFDEECRVVCSAAAIPGKYIVEAGIFNTGAIYRWFKEEFGYQGKGFDEINKEALSSPIGSNGVILIPHFEGSAAPYWNPLSRGMFFNLSLGTKRSDMARAIIEGIALEIAENVELIQSLVGELSTVAVAGGMTKFHLFNTIQANALNMKIEKYDNSEATSLGATINAYVSLGIYDSIEEAFYQMIPDEPEEVFPAEEDVAFYRELRKKKNNLYYALKNGGVI